MMSPSSRIRGQGGALRHEHAAGRVGQEELALGADFVAVFVEDDPVRAQHAALVEDLDVAGGGQDAGLAVVGDLVGDQARGRDGCDRSDRRSGGRLLGADGSRHGGDGEEEPGEGGSPPGHQPSSRCRRRPTARRIAATGGVQAATMRGIWPRPPRGLGEVLEEVEGEAGEDGEEDHHSGLPEAGGAQREGGADQDHGGEERRLGELALEEEPVALAGEARLLHLGDEAAEVPEAHGLGRGEALEDLLARQRRRQVEPAAVGGGAVEAAVGLEAPLDRVGQDPGPAGQPRLRRLDARVERPLGVEAVHRDPAQDRAVGVGPRGLDHRLAVRVALAQPDALLGEGEEARSAAVEVIDHRLPAPDRGGDEGIDDRHEADAEEERGDDRHGDEAERRDAGRAHHHELARAGEAQEGDEAREHEHQGEDLVEHFGGLEQGDAHHVAGTRAGFAEAAQVLDRGEEDDDQRDHREDREDRAQEAAQDVAPERHAAPPARAPAGRRARLSRTRRTPR